MEFFKKHGTVIAIALAIVGIIVFFTANAVVLNPKTIGTKQAFTGAQVTFGFTENVDVNGDIFERKQLSPSIFSIIFFAIMIISLPAIALTFHKGNVKRVTIAAIVTCGIAILFALLNPLFINFYREGANESMRNNYYLLPGAGAIVYSVLLLISVGLLTLKIIPQKNLGRLK